MRTRLLLATILGVELVLGAWPSPVRAATDSDKRMVAIVAARIFAEAEPVQGWAWPPLVAISQVDRVNAFATICQVKPGELPEVTDEENKPMKYEWIEVEVDTLQSGDLGADDVTPANSSAASGAEATVVVHQDEPAEHRIDEHEDGTITQPVIILHQGFLDDIVRGSADRLAAVFGHETSHILLRHVDNVTPGGLLVANMVTRHQEADADLLGMKLGLAADFPYKGLVSGVLAMRENGNYTSFEGLNASHPGWTDRVAMIDSEQSELWQSISAFENGVYFLTTEQYALAQDCFEQVTKECPKCYEAWANLGYARLMMYCDKLDPEDLRDFGIGQLVVGGFYRRPDSIEGPTRAVDNQLWFGAVEALRQATILSPELVLPKANLATAYMVSPDGPDVSRAGELFAEVVAALKSGDVEEMDPLVRASLLVNAGVAELGTGDSASAEALFAEAQQLFSADGRPMEGSASIQSAIRYNRGRMYAAAGEPAKRRTALEELEQYLTTTSSAANWWPLAYEQYAKLCADQGVEAKSEDALSSVANRLNRMVSGIALADGTNITLNASADETLGALEEALGAAVERDIVKKSNIRRVSYAKAGVELLAANEIVAIRLRGRNAPPVVLRASGPGGDSAEVRPGMSLADLEEVLGGDAPQWDRRFGTNAQIVYRFYTRLGFGVRLSGDKVTEIIVAQIPVEARVE